MAIATLGALILWIGWYGFNPGSELAMDQYVAYVAVTTTLAAAGGAIGATVVSTITSGKPDLTMIINGILAGLYHRRLRQYDHGRLLGCWSHWRHHRGVRCCRT